MNLNIIDINNKKVDKFVFDFDDSFEINRKVISQVVRWQLSKRRSGTASTKNRALVSSSNRKPFKQKGTGNARSGSRTSPIWRGGGVIFGPTPKNWSLDIPKKIKKMALMHSVVYKIQQNSFTIIDSLLSDVIARYSDVEDIIFVGNSAGGQLLNRFAGGSPATLNEKIKFIISAPSSFLYFDEI